MKISNAKRDEAGEWKFDMAMGEEEVSFLVELSMTSLIKVGVIKIEEKEEEQQINLKSSDYNRGSIQ